MGGVIVGEAPVNLASADCLKGDGGEQRCAAIKRDYEDMATPVSSAQVRRHGLRTERRLAAVCRGLRWGENVGPLAGRKKEALNLPAAT